MLINLTEASNPRFCLLLYVLGVTDVRVDVSKCDRLSDYTRD